MKSPLIRSGFPLLEPELGLEGRRNPGGEGFSFFDEPQDVG
jgi:hypothetical protein